MKSGRNTAMPVPDVSGASPPTPGSTRRVGLGLVVALVAVTALVGVGVGVFVGSSLTGGGSSSGAPSIPAGNGVRTTPEDAVQQYIDGITANDADLILGACGVGLVAEGYQFDRLADRLEAIVSSMLAPSEYSLYRTMNEYAQADSCLESARWSAYSLLTSEPFGPTIMHVTLAQAQQYAKDVDPSLLASLRVTLIKFPVASKASDAKILASFAGQAECYGADELTERLALLQWNGDYYKVGFQLLRYGNDWIVFRMQSALGNVAAAEVKATTPDQFDADTGS
jgi:hypothetical protein